jgi:hypothetical protein
MRFGSGSALPETHTSAIAANGQSDESCRSNAGW